VIKKPRERGRDSPPWAAEPEKITIIKMERNSRKILFLKCIIPKNIYEKAMCK
jgi:hypothetical protein